MCKEASLTLKLTRRSRALIPASMMVPKFSVFASNFSPNLSSRPIGMLLTWVGDHYGGRVVKLARSWVQLDCSWRLSSSFQSTAHQVEGERETLTNSGQSSLRPSPTSRRQISQTLSQSMYLNLTCSSHPSLVSSHTRVEVSNFLVQLLIICLVGDKAHLLMPP